MATQSSAGFLFPARVRSEVLGQHTVLREILQEMLEATTRGLREEVDLGELAEAARELHRRFCAHLLFEERSLLPILAAEELWGPERAGELLEEHARQRAELDTLIEGLDAGWDTSRVALTLRSLVTDLLRDMGEEEQGCLRHQILEEPVIEAPRNR
jgi:hypothetical protein